MSEPNVEASSPSLEADGNGTFRHPAAMLALVVLSVGWVAYLAFGQVRARFWLLGEHQIEWKSIRSIWSVQMDELPGGAAVQWLFAGSMLVFALGVIAGLYLLLIAPDGETEPVEGSA